MDTLLTKTQHHNQNLHVKKNFTTCINALQSKKICDNCESICPQNIMRSNPCETTNFENCIDCNLCLASCPTKSISFSNKTALTIKKICEDTSHKCVHIGCQKTQNFKELKLFCIASLPWEFLVYMALKKPIVFFIDSCPSCKFNSYLSTFKDSLIRAKEFLTEDLYTQRVFLEQKTYDSKDTKRVLFKKMKNYLKDLIQEINLDLPDNINRQSMLKHLKEHSEVQNCGWKTLAIQNTCIGCGICEKMCPNDAIEIQKQKNSISFMHSVVKCMECGLCETVCLFKAIDGFETHITNKAILTTIVTHITPKQCVKCFKFIENNQEEICQECKSKSSTFHFFG